MVRSRCLEGRPWSHALSTPLLASVLIAVTLFADTSPDSAAAAGVEPQQIREIIELRDATSKTYDLGEGRREWVGYSEAVHYRDNSGSYQE